MDSLRVVKDIFKDTDLELIKAVQIYCTDNNLELMIDSLLILNSHTKSGETTKSQTSKQKFYKAIKNNFFKKDNRRVGIEPSKEVHDLASDFSLAFNMQTKEEISVMTQEIVENQDMIYASHVQEKEIASISDKSLKDIAKECLEGKQVGPSKKEPEPEPVCVACLSEKIASLFVPCAHSSCCLKCAQSIFKINKVCPICRTKLEGLIESSPKN